MTAAGMEDDAVTVGARTDTPTVDNRWADSGCWDDVRGLVVAVLGLGRSGIAAANALARRGADVQVYDDRPAEQLESAIAKLLPTVSVRTGGGYVARPGEIAVLSPGIPMHSPTFRRARASALRVIGEVELFYRLNRARNDGLGHPLIAVSGTDGKTTTATLIAHLLRAGGHNVCLAGNIGIPLCEVLDDIADDAAVVAEVSAFQLATCTHFRPRVSVLTNIAADHDDWFGGDRALYAATKRAVAARAGCGDTVVTNLDDGKLAEVGAGVVGLRRFVYSIRDPSGDGLRLRDGGLVFDDGAAVTRLAGRDDLGTPERPLIGDHNVANALASAGAALAMGVSSAVIRAGLRTFEAPAHRLQPAGHIGAIRFIDDSKATNPHAACAGLRAVQLADDDKLIWIGGGSEKDADFGPLHDAVKERVTTAVLIGQTAERIAAVLPDDLPRVFCGTMQEAVAESLTLAQPGGVVLLGPACASFDMFSSYAHRGDVFQDAVKRLGQAISADR